MELAMINDRAIRDTRESEHRKVVHYEEFEPDVVARIMAVVEDTVPGRLFTSACETQQRASQ